MLRHLSLAAVLLLGSTNAGGMEPQRPLPRPVSGQLTKGPVRFVDPAAGDDKANGSRQHPWRSLQHSVTRLRPGDTLYLRGGTYYEKVYLTRKDAGGDPGTFLDPWDEQYIIIVDTDYDGKIKYRGQIYTTPVVVFSKGPNAEEDEAGEYEDDIANVTPPTNS